MDEGQTTKSEQDGAANGSQPFSSQEESNVIGGWLPSLTFSLEQMKQRSPVVSALMMLACIWGGYIALFILGNFAVALLWGAAAEMNWPFSFLLLLLSPFVFIGGAIDAIVKFNRERSRQAADITKVSR